MNLKEFADNLRKEVDLFELWWKTRAQKYPDTYPLEMEEDDWYQNFMTSDLT